MQYILYLINVKFIFYLQFLYCIIKLPNKHFGIRECLIFIMNICSYLKQMNSKYTYYSLVMKNKQSKCSTFKKEIKIYYKHWKKASIVLNFNLSFYNHVLTMHYRYCPSSSPHITVCIETRSKQKLPNCSDCLVYFFFFFI